MALVQFAMICDGCDKRSPEYQGWATCRECVDDVCPDCCDMSTCDPETCFVTQCNRCKAAEGGMTPKLIWRTIGHYINNGHVSYRLPVTFGEKEEKKETVCK